MNSQDLVNSTPPTAPKTDGYVSPADESMSPPADSDGPIISSILEGREDSIKSYVIEQLTDNLTLHYIMLYLLIILALALFSRWFFSGPVSLDRFPNYSYGTTLTYILNRYLAALSTVSNI